MHSLWSDYADFNSFPELNEDINTDVLIVGGGIAGLLCAYELENRGIDYILIEKNKICSKVSENTTAKVTCQHGLIYGKIVDKYGYEFARMYYEANNNALNKIRLLSKRYTCDFENKTSFVYSMNNEKILHKESEVLSRLGVKSDISYNLRLPFKVKGAVKIQNQGQFNPCMFLSKISRKLKIYENTEAVEYSPGKIKTKRGEIKAKKIIIATHFPIFNNHGGYFIKMYQYRSYVIAINKPVDVEGIYVDEADKGMSFRNYKENFLIGGGGHRTGKNGGCYKELIDFKDKYFPECEITHKWATQDCITLDGIPYIGKYSENVSDLYVITGFNKWGMTNAAAGAEIICDMIEDKNNPFELIYSPQRTSLHPQLFINIGESFLSYIKPIKPRCPHLGCALKYNKEEHTWDCSCHGSRFDEQGVLIDNPSTGNIKKLNKKH